MHGVVLIEVLVAMLIFMFGVLGLVGLQASVTRAQTDSKVRADASYLASDMVGRMWSDRTHITSYSSANCSSLQFCKDWQTKVASSLPNGSTVVSVAVGANNVTSVTISISWTGPDGQTHQYVTNTTIV